MSKYKSDKFFLFSVLIFVITSCSNTPEKNNLNILKKVERLNSELISHYNKPEDILKKKASLFLINNVYNKFQVKRECIISYIDSINKNSKHPINLEKGVKLIAFKSNYMLIF